MNKQQALAEHAAAVRAPEDFIAGILEADSDAELEIYRAGLVAWIGQSLQAVGAALCANGQRVAGAKAQARGRAAEAEWPPR